MSEAISRGVSVEQKAEDAQDLPLHSSPPPISRLPAELLEDIFLQTWSESPFMKSLVRIPYPVLIAQVCRTWRVVTLDYAGLWTCIPLRIGRQWAYEFARRSKTLDLTLSGLTTANDYSKLYWLLDFIRDHLHRIADLDLDGLDEASLPAYHSVLASSALERLAKITLTMGGSHSVERQVAMALFRATRLRDVNLTEVSLPWDALCWSGLRSVEICLPRYRPVSSDLKTLVDSLSTASALKTLHLKMYECHFTYPTIGDPFCAVTHIPQLRYFGFKGSVDDFRVLCDALKMPPAVSLSLDLDEAGADDLSSDNVAESVPSTLSTILRAHTFRVHELSLHASRRDCAVSFWAKLSTLTPDHISEVQEGNISIDVQLPRSEDSMYDLEYELLALYQNIDAQSIRTLRLDFCYDKGNNGWDEETWRSLLRPARNVESLHLSGEWVETVLGLLSSPIRTILPSATDQEPAESTSSAEILLPLARHIYFRNSGLQHRNAYDMALLPDWVDARAQLAPVKTLSIERCAIRRQTVDKLREVNGLKLEWDEDQGVFCDIDDCKECDGEGCDECLGEDFNSDHESDEFYFG